MNPRDVRHHWPRCAALALLACLFFGGCGSSAPLAPELTERAHRLRVALVDLRARPGAERLVADLERADLWLQRAEIARAAEAPDSGRIEQVLDAVEVQLARVKAGLARRDAEEALAERQRRYVEQTGRIEAYRRQVEPEQTEETGR